MNAVIALALKQRILMVALFLLVIVIGVVCFLQLNIEAYPDPVPPQVEIITQANGQAAEEIERYYTIPLEIQMGASPNVTAIRSISLFGLSDVRISFTYAFTYDEAQHWVINRLSQLSPLPNGASPQISPESPIGEIYRYRIAGPPGYSVTDLKTVQDWILERRFKAVPGVIDVGGWAGRTKTYDVTVDLDKLMEYGVRLPRMIQVINNSNINVGGQAINFGPQSAIVRGVGLIHTMDDLRNTMLTSNNGVPVYVKDVATVEVGHEPRFGIGGQDNDDDIVQGIVLMRRGEQSLPTIHRVEAEVEKINDGSVLPPGVHLAKIDDRRELSQVQRPLAVVVGGILLAPVLILLVLLVLIDLFSQHVAPADVPAPAEGTGSENAVSGN
jgi:heavy metal efflux system protein